MSLIEIELKRLMIVFLFNKSLIVYKTMYFMLSALDICTCNCAFALLSE